MRAHDSLFQFVRFIQQNRVWRNLRAGARRCRQTNEAQLSAADPVDSENFGNSLITIKQRGDEFCDINHTAAANGKHRVTFLGARLGQNAFKHPKRWLAIDRWRLGKMNSFFFQCVQHDARNGQDRRARDEQRVFYSALREEFSALRSASRSRKQCGLAEEG